MGVDEPQTNPGVVRRESTHAATVASTAAADTSASGEGEGPAFACAFALLCDQGPHRLKLKQKHLLSYDSDLHWLSSYVTTVSSLLRHGYDLQGPEFNIVCFPRTPRGSILAFFLFVFIPAMGEFDQTIGFTLMGVTVNTYLTGLIMSQFFTYWNARYQDPCWIKLLVAFLFIANTTQAGAVVYMSWFYCVTNFANPRVVAISLWPDTFTSLITAILAITNQMLQTWRIYLFAGNRILIGFLVATSVVACGTGVAASIEAWISFRQAKHVSLQSIVEVNLALQFSIDVIIASELYLFLVA
ncbi:hypothetical protein MVEN_01865800 [Mycena venus]|uniref:Uncharacterized protein n=1 Tax=Mycena venus TaxID=2733690 RepID=A0A8H6XHR7_9AGAR|nr:hypothetical protein MVEN_01865800 [Mycena venus]